MNVTALFSLILTIIIPSILALSVAPSVIQQIKKNKVENRVVATQNALFDSINRYITNEKDIPIDTNELISKGYFNGNSNNNGFGGVFKFSIDDKKGTVKITTEIADADARTAFIRSYKNTFKPIQEEGNKVSTTFVLSLSTLHDNSDLIDGIPVQSIAPDASTNKYWYDTSGAVVIFKISDGTKWKTISSNVARTVTTNQNVISDEFVNEIDNLGSAQNGDTKYAYNGITNQISEYKYYNGYWYSMNTYDAK